MWNHPNFGSCEDLEKLNRVKIELAFDIKLTTERMYLNGQSHGQCGQLHTDLLNIPEEENNEYLTLVYYANENWHPEWGGYTVVVDKNNDIQIFYPKPNSAIIFNSRFPHVGLEPTINFKGLRITMAHKFKITEKP